MLTIAAFSIVVRKSRNIGKHIYRSCTILVARSSVGCLVLRRRFRHKGYNWSSDGRMDVLEEFWKQDVKFWFESII